MDGGDNKKRAAESLAAGDSKGNKKIKEASPASSERSSDSLLDIQEAVVFFAFAARNQKNRFFFRAKRIALLAFLTKM